MHTPYMYVYMSLTTLNKHDTLNTTLDSSQHLEYVENVSVYKFIFCINQGKICSVSHSKMLRNSVHLLIKFVIG